MLYKRWLADSLKSGNINATPYCCIGYTFLLMAIPAIASRMRYFNANESRETT